MRDTLVKQKHIAVIIPCYNEEAAVHHIVDALSALSDSIKKYSIDVILINDGSTDNTQQILEDFSNKYDNVYYQNFSQNAGHQSALRAGINASVNYDAVIMMDSDMQHPPELIPSMIKVWEKGIKIVQMTRNDSARDVGKFKYLTSKTYYRFINYMSGLKLEYGASDFRLIDKSVATMVANSHESNLFLRGYFSWLPVSRQTISYKPNKRIGGESKYSLRKMLNLAYEGILQFSEKPLRIAITIGVILANLSFIYGVVLIVLHFSGTKNVSGWTSLMVVLVFCFSINFILLGIIGNYLAHSISIQKQRPEFVISSEKLPKKS